MKTIESDDRLTLCWMNPFQMNRWANHSQNRANGFLDPLSSRVRRLRRLLLQSAQYRWCPLRRVVFERLVTFWNTGC